VKVLRWGVESIQSQLVVSSSPIQKQCVRWGVENKQGQLVVPSSPMHKQYVEYM
jgi:hypothetical protein